MKKLFAVLFVIALMAAAPVAEKAFVSAEANGPAEPTLEKRVDALETKLDALMVMMEQLVAQKAAEAPAPAAAPAVTSGDVVSEDVYVDTGAVTYIVAEPVEAVVTGTGVIDPKQVTTGFPLPPAGEEYRWHRAPITVLELVQAGAHIQGLGIGNMSAAVTYKGPDGAVPSTAVLQDGVILDPVKKAAVGTMVLYDKKGRTIDRVLDYSYRGIVYWAQIRRTEATTVVKGMKIHWKSAHDRKVGTVIPAGELFTIFFLNTREADIGKDNGTEACGTVFPVQKALVF